MPKVENVDTPTPGMVIEPSSVAVFSVFVAGQGQSLRAQQAIKDVTAFLDEELPGRYRLHVVDILRNAQAARDAAVFVTPAVFRTDPTESVRVFGCLTNREKMKSLLMV